jgi:hypothetical protein
MINNLIQNIRHMKKTIHASMQCHILLLIRFLNNGTYDFMMCSVLKLLTDIVKFSISFLNKETLIHIWNMLLVLQL